MERIDLKVNWEWNDMSIKWSSWKDRASESHAWKVALRCYLTINGDYLVEKLNDYSS